MTYTLYKPTSLSATLSSIPADKASFSIDPTNTQITLTGVSIGSSQFTLSYQAKTDRNVNITYTVLTNVSSISITTTETELFERDTMTLTSSITPVTGSVDTSVTWTSSDPSVATVDSSSGLLTAKRVGTVRITCKSVHDTSKTDFIDIKVNSIGNAPFFGTSF